MFCFSQILMLHGRPGSGKSTLLRVAAATIGFVPLVINAAGGDENAASVAEKISTGLTTDCIFDAQSSGSKPFLILVEELDAAPGDVAGIIVNTIIRVLANGVKPLRRPIVIICADPWVYSLRPLREASHMVSCMVSVPRASERLNEILSARQIFIKERSQLERLIDLSGGDIRESLNALQFTFLEAQQGKMAPMEEGNDNNENRGLKVSTLIAKAIASIGNIACAPSANLYFKVCCLFPPFSRTWRISFWCGIVLYLPQ